MVITLVTLNIGFVLQSQQAKSKNALS